MKKFFHIAKPRGFNMFSAIVAIILVMTGVVLTSTLISTEEKTSRQIYSMLNNYQLSDAANLARADALQSFNYNFREKLEDYLTFSSTELREDPGFQLFTIDGDGKTFTFDDMKSDFEKSILLTDTNEGQKFDATVSFIANRTVDQFQGGTYGKFSVYLSDKTSKAKDAIYRATKEAIAAQGSSFLEVVKCDDVSCIDGSFYFNIPLNLISDEEYEDLPRIIVKDLVTQEEIKMAILPRTNIKVYIPLRFFKALHEARKTAYAIEQSKPELENYKLGFCDGASSCAPRTNPKNPVGSSSWDSACPTSGFDPPVDFEGIAAAELAKLGLTSYPAGGRVPGQNALKAFGAEEVCKNAISLKAFETDDADDTFGVLDSVLSPGDGRLIAIGGCGINNLVTIVNSEATHVTNLGTEEKLYCSRVTAMRADVVFEETNPNYIVKGTAEAGKKNYYKIRIYDTTYTQANIASYTDPNLPKCYSNAGAHTCSPS